jgi:hypothetical protein
VSVKLPAAQGVQLAAPAAALKLPTAHGLQRTANTLPLRMTSEYWPAQGERDAGSGRVRTADRRKTDDAQRQQQ